MYVHGCPKTEVTMFDCSRLHNPWTNLHVLAYYNAVRLNTCVKPRLHDTTCCQTGCQTGLTTGCIVYTNIYPVVKRGLIPVVSCKRGLRSIVTDNICNTKWCHVTIKSTTTSRFFSYEVNEATAVDSPHLQNNCTNFHSLAYCNVVLFIPLSSTA